MNEWDMGKYMKGWVNEWTESLRDNKLLYCLNTTRKLT